ncbi:putative disease resistance RPP13-like protein 1 isoform X2 [Triticum urartu]|uniref:putative disease resistance RPP13-like protein 1 isoform X2 n=1 Tax=Triticum urartu TaxID=4572 RepID=UPI0020433F5A|nr:putative disease resistance RPP13-like protein 1 isoform X2 [Triticum urartu]
MCHTFGRNAPHRLRHRRRRQKSRHTDSSNLLQSLSAVPYLLLPRNRAPISRVSPPTCFGRRFCPSPLPALPLMADPVTAAAAAIGWGLKAVGWVASPVISDLFKKCSSFVSFDTSEKLRKLEPKIFLLERVMEMMAESPHRVRLQQLFEDLKTAFYEAEDILDDVEYHRLKKEVQDYELTSDGPPSTMDLLKHKVQSLAVSPLTNKETGMSKKQLKRSLEKIEKVINEAHQILEWLNLPTVNKGQPSAANACTTATSPVKVIGRDEDRDKIIEMLHQNASHGKTNMNSSLCYSVVGIHGIAGSGKSTLAQFVFAQEEKDKLAEKDGHFDILLWVHVSQKPSIEAIYRRMFEAIEGYDCELNSLDRLQQELKDILTSKRFFLVLDDVWCNKDVGEQNLPQLLSPFKIGKRGSKILATSRNVDAFSDLGPDVRCANFPISDLGDSMFLELFMYHALGDRHADDGVGSTLWNIGVHIAKKLKRSPLAASTVGGQLRKRKNVEFWRRARDRDLLNETMGALSWSYQHLNEQIRQCFAYCSMFPRGHHFRPNVLLKLWVAEGFIRSTNAGKEMEDVGQDYFDELVSISFLQYGGKESCGEDYYLMHDLMYDLAERIAGHDCFRIEDGWTGEIPPGVRHLFIDTYNGEKLAMKIFQLENLRTLIIKVIKLWTPRDEEVFKNIIMRLQKLRVLNVTFGLTWHVNFLEPIGVKHIRHLTYRIGKSHGLILPRTFKKLHHIQTLDFGNCKRLSLSKDEVGINLVSLRHVGNASILKLVNIARSTSLQELGPYFTVSKERGCNIKHLRDLNQLRGRLRIRGVENVKSSEEALEAKLADKERLTELELCWDCDQESCNPEVEVEVLEGLCPPKDLEKLELCGYNGARYPNWMVGRQNGGLKCLQVLKLWKCSLGPAPVFEVFTLLRVLSLSACIWVTLPDNMVRLKSLEELSIELCQNIQSLPALPHSLKKLSIKYCKNIRSLPVLPQSLEELSIDYCPNIQSLPVLPQALTKLSTVDCPNIQSPPELLRSLEEFEV